MTDDSARVPGARTSQPSALGPTADAQEDRQLVAATLQGTCTRVTENLRDTMGVDGSTALLARALARTERQHPALLVIRRQDGREIHLDGVAAALETHGHFAVDKAIIALLDALVAILGRLIGDDMARRIIDLGASRDEQRGLR